MNKSQLTDTGKKGVIMFNYILYLFLLLNVICMITQVVRNNVDRSAIHLACAIGIHVILLMRGAA